MALYIIDEQDIDDLKRAHNALLDTPFRDDRIETARYLIAQVLDHAEETPDDGIFP